MRIFGIEVRRSKNSEKQLSGVSPPRIQGFFGTIREPFTGAWQKNKEIKRETVLSYHAVYSCITLIASDVGKLAPTTKRLVDGIWSDDNKGANYKLLLKPNHYQNHIQFKEHWMMSRLTHGNTYVLKNRDETGKVIGLYVLDPTLVKPLVTDLGTVYYELNADNLSAIEEKVVVPASEIIHDRMNCLYHPLVGVSPIYACSVSAGQGLAIQNQSSKFFDNNSQPTGILTAPGAISDETADRLSRSWQQKYGPNGKGGVAVLGDGLRFEAMTMTATDAQLIEQLGMTAKVVCGVFHVPAYLAGVGEAPSYSTVEQLYQQYYNQCLQSHIESMEWLLDEGISMPDDRSVELDLDGLLRMDTTTQNKVLTEGISGGLMSPNEARKKKNLPPVEGGETPYLQQQNYSLGALSRRDRESAPPGINSQNQPKEPDETEKALEMLYQKDIL